MKPGRDLWWHELMADASRRLPRRAARQRAPAVTSSTPPARTGKPKGVLHTTGGYLLGVSLTHEWVFDIKEDDIYWCTADIGWVTGHSYIVYGPLANGATVGDVRGRPEPPDARTASGRSSRSTSVTIFYTAPTAIRAFIKWGDQWPKGHDLSSAALARHGRRADQPGSVDVVPRRHRRRPLPDRRYLVADRNRGDHDLAAARRDADQARQRDQAAARASTPRWSTSRATRCRANQGGFLVIRSPGRACCGRSTATTSATSSSTGARCPACYFTADGARSDEDGYFWIMGRVDDVLNVSGHRLSTMEVESALVHHPKVAEAAVVGRPDEIKGEGDRLLRDARQGGTDRREELKKELREHVAKEIGALARPDDIRFTDALPKTRSRQDHAAAAARHRRRQADAPATRRRSKTTACWPSCARRRSEREGGLRRNAASFKNWGGRRKPTAPDPSRQCRARSLDQPGVRGTGAFEPEQARGQELVPPGRRDARRVLQHRRAELVVVRSRCPSGRSARRPASINALQPASGLPFM